VLSPKDSPLGKQLSKYVCVRITRMDDVDIGLFDRDWNNTLYYFMLNADEQIYMRYGGRDSESPETYLHLNSLEIALRQGLELHRRYLKGELKKTERPKPLLPRQIPLLVERTYARNQCVECHLIGDFQNLQREQDGVLDRLAQLYRSPGVKALGIDLDVPQGLVVKEVRGAVQAAGMKPGDRIAALNGTPVWTFGDFQCAYDKVDRKAQKIEIAVDRAGAPVNLTVALPPRWWWTDTRFRQSSVEPRTYFEDRPLAVEEKMKYGLKPDGFASQVTYVSDFAKVMKSHDLRAGDIIFGVDGVERDEFANTADLHIKLRKPTEGSVTLEVIRDGKRIQIPLRTFRLSFRK
jgi:serine protease Do